MSLLAPDAKHADRAALVALVADCASSGVARRVLLLRADRLPPSLARPHHLRLAREALLPLEGAARAVFYDLGTDRAAVSWRSDDGAALTRSLALLAHLMTDAPPGTPPLSDLVALYDLPKAGAVLLEAVGDPPPDNQPPPAPPLEPLDAAALTGMEAALAQADVSRFARLRPVWRHHDGKRAIAWRKRHLSIPELAAALVPGRDARAEPWLFHRLTRTLDRRVLAMLSVPGEMRSDAPFSISLNVATVVSPEFLRFDMVLPAGLRGQVVLELLPADIVADPASYVFARGFVRQRGYKLLLRGVDAELLPMLALDRLDPDYVALRWTPALMEGALAETPLPLDPARVVLSRADTGDAVRWGSERGITLFQGKAAEAG